MLTRPGQSQYQQSAYMIGLGPGWIFTGPFVTYPIDVGSLDPTSVESIDVAEQTAELITIGALLRDYSDGSTDPNVDY